MYTGEVIGSVVATVKEEHLEGIPLLVVQVIENGKRTKKVIAADATRQAGHGDFVYLIGSKEAARMFRKKLTPADAAIVGFIDSYREEL
ncbi:EutN/CcmL family microcompartment protein [uncultured Pseudoflavonifractor sp.]|uniref:EutN/CcmL family microcompartment protein n=1 Tax=uncultured Pseudoflavonifractor sp. TaxID=1221379 RepID=UPI0025E4EE04|nr:EutN/CcmL family microcompartment protein [uncultured Pseudoflavonifractor sp.]